MGSAEPRVLSGNKLVPMRACEINAQAPVADFKAAMCELLVQERSRIQQPELQADCLDVSGEVLHIGPFAQNFALGSYALRHERLLIDGQQLVTCWSLRR